MTDQHNKYTIQTMRDTEAGMRQRAVALLKDPEARVQIAAFLNIFNKEGELYQAATGIYCIRMESKDFTKDTIGPISTGEHKIMQIFGNRSISVVDTTGYYSIPGSKRSKQNQLHSINLEMFKDLCAQFNIPLREELHQHISSPPTPKHSR